MTEWKPGMFYDVGGAAALFWPDQHPEHPDPELAQRWLVFDPWGGLDIVIGRLPREDFIGPEMGLAPFLVSEPEPVREVWQRARCMPVEESVLEEMRQRLEDSRSPIRTGREVSVMSDPETEQTEEQQGRGDTHNGPTFPDRSS